MVVIILFLIGLSFVGGIILGIANIASGGKIFGVTQSGSYYSDEHGYHCMGFDHGSRGSSKRDNRSNSNPFDNHWESSFDWKDKDNNGYDDRNDGFWNEREF